MQRQGISHQTTLLNNVRKTMGLVDFRHPIISNRSLSDLFHSNPAIQCRSRSIIIKIKSNSIRRSFKMRCILDRDDEELSDDDELCPVECVREFYTDDEFLKVLEKSKESNALVVVDFYRTSCGSCKYIEQGFVKLCKGSGDQEASVVFLKHNVIDEYDEQSEVADRLRIKTVPLFHFYKNGILLEAFPTRDKERILGAILKYTDAASKEVDSIL